MKKITAVAVLCAILLTNVPFVNAEWKHNTEYLKHWFPSLMSKAEKSATKDKQLCKIATSFEILNYDGTVKEIYYPQGCQEKKEDIEDIEDIEDNETISNEDNENVDGFINNIFWDTSESNKEETVESNDYTEPNNIDENSSETDNTNSGSTQDESVDDLFKDIFWKTNNNTNLSLKGSKFVKTINDYSKQKIRIRVGNVEANVLWNDMEYNAKVATLLKQIDSELKINSIKNSLAKNISNVSYSFSTYKNTTDLETKEVFRNKLVKDLKTLKKKYKILKNKDAMISATLERRGQL